MIFCFPSSRSYNYILSSLWNWQYSIIFYLIHLYFGSLSRRNLSPIIWSSALYFYKRPYNLSYVFYSNHTINHTLYNIYVYICIYYSHYLTLFPLPLPFLSHLIQLFFNLKIPIWPRTCHIFSFCRIVPATRTIPTSCCVLPSPSASLSCSSFFWLNVCVLQLNSYSLTIEALKWNFHEYHGYGYTALKSRLRCSCSWARARETDRVKERARERKKHCACCV